LNEALHKKEVVPQVVFENKAEDIPWSPSDISSATSENIAQLKVIYNHNNYKYTTYKLNEDKETFEITSLKDQKKHQAYRILGQVANSYLIVEYEAGFYIIDQHAAHERVLYEKVMAEFVTGPVESQYLMYPILWIYLHLKWSC